MITRAFGMKFRNQDIIYDSMVKTISGEDFGLFIQRNPTAYEDYSTSHEIPIWMGPNEDATDFGGIEGCIIVAGIVTPRNYPEQGEVPGMPLGGDHGEVHFWRYLGEAHGLYNINFFTFLAKCFKINWAINISEFGGNAPTFNASPTPTQAEYANLLDNMRKYGMWTNHPYWKLYSGDTTDYNINHIRNPTFGAGFWSSGVSVDIYDVILPPQ